MDRIPSVRRAILADRPVAANLAWTAAAIVVPAALRWMIDQGHSGIPFITFFPAVLIVSVFLGWKYGAVSALASGVLANRLFRPEPLVFFVSGRDAVLVGLFFLTCAILVGTGAALRRVVRDQEAARLREEALKRELIHRGKNILTVVQSLATLTARNCEPGEFSDKFGSRLLALDNANHLLANAERDWADLRQAVDKAIEAFRDRDNIAVSGDAYLIPKSTIIPISLALHELCTNAAKYGALSVNGGKVAIDWRPAEKNGELLLSWREIGGPAVEPPSRKGMGSLLLRAQNGLPDVRLSFAQSGVECLLTVPIAKAENGAA